MNYFFFSIQSLWKQKFSPYLSPCIPHQVYPSKGNADVTTPHLFLYHDLSHRVAQILSAFVVWSCRDHWHCACPNSESIVSLNSELSVERGIILSRTFSSRLHEAYPEDKCSPTKDPSPRLLFFYNIHVSTLLQLAYELLFFFDFPLRRFCLGKTHLMRAMIRENAEGLLRTRPKCLTLPAWYLKFTTKVI